MMTMVSRRLAEKDRAQPRPASRVAIGAALFVTILALLSGAPAAGGRSAGFGQTAGPVLQMTRA